MSNSNEHRTSCLLLGGVQGTHSPHQTRHRNTGAPYDFYNSKILCDLAIASLLDDDENLYNNGLLHTLKLEQPTILIASQLAILSRVGLSHLACIVT